MTYSLRVSNSFERDLRKLSASDRERVWTALEEIQKSPYSYKPLRGQLEGTRSARLGTLRIIYTVDEQQKHIILLHVGYRERVYEG